MTIQAMNDYVQGCREVIDAQDAYYAACDTGCAVKIAETMAAFRKLREEMKARHPGFTLSEARECFSRA